MATEANLLDTSDAGPAAIRGGIVRIAVYAAGLALSVGSAALLFRHLGVDDTGRYVTVLSVVTVAGGLTDAGLVNIAVREYALREGRDRARLMRSLLAVRVLLTGAGVAAAVAFSALAGYGSTLVLGTALAGLGMLVLGLQSLASTPLTTHLRLGSVALLDFLRQVVVVGAIVGLVFAGAGVLAFLAIPNLLGALLVLGLTVWLVRGQMPARPSFARAGVGGLLRDTAAYAAAAAVSTLYFRLAIIVMSLTATAAQTGYFSASFRIVEVLTAIPPLSVGAAFPILARSAAHDRARFRYAVQRTWEASTIVGAWLALCLGLGAPVLIAIVAGDDFDPAIVVLRFQAVAMVGMFCAFAATYALLSLHRYRDLLVVTLVGLAVNLGLVLALTPGLGARGAAMASSATELVLALVSGWLLLRAPDGFALQLGVVPRVGLAAGLAVAPAAIPGLPAIPLVVLGSAIFFGVLLAVRAIPQELLDEVARLRRRLARGA